MNNFFEFAAITDAGNKKKVNEDQILAVSRKFDETLPDWVTNNDIGLFVVADGVGGLAAAAEASACIISEISKWWESALTFILSQKLSVPQLLDVISNELDQLIYAANEDILDFSKRNCISSGTTVSILFIMSNKYIIKNVGDSRVYSIGNDIRQMTGDHSWVHEQLRLGLINASEIKDHPYRKVLTQCVGVKKELEIFSETGTIDEKEIFLVCSDGLYHLLSDEDMISVAQTGIKHNRSFHSIASRLVWMSKTKGEKDNISAILVRVNKREYSMSERFMNSLNGLIGRNSLRMKKA